ncbi:MAG: hypothetical protein ACSHX6_12990 [Akkermansiaceae bacterium]
MRFRYPPSAEEIAREKKSKVDPSYYIDLKFDDRTVHWSFYLPLPEGMHWKKGDEMGLGSEHHESTQHFDDFLIKPYKELPEKIYQEIVHHIWRHDNK